MTTGLSDRARGVLLGLAVGDALGGPLERLSPIRIRELHGGPVREMVGGGWLSLAPGQGTDDTAMALALARALAAAPDADGYDPRAALAGYLGWFAGDPPDIGETTRAALSAGPDPADVAAAVASYARPPGRSGGNGSLMRIAPVAVRFLDDPGARRAAARGDSALTHRDAVAADACAWLCDVLAALIRDGGEADGVRGRGFVAPEGLSAAWSAGAEAAATAAWSPEAASVSTTLAVAAAALDTADTLEQGLVWAVNLGGDADTYGAVAGALLGARFGASAIPSRWLAPLRGRAELTRLADALLIRGAPGVGGVRGVS